MKKYKHFFELYDSTLKRLVESNMSNYYRKNYYVSDIVRGTEGKWIIKLERKTAF